MAEVREVITIKDPENPGRVLNVFLTEQEVKSTLEAGLNALLAAGYINFITAREAGVAIDIDEEQATKQ